MYCAQCTHTRTPIAPYFTCIKKMSIIFRFLQFAKAKQQEQAEKKLFWLSTPSSRFRSDKKESNQKVKPENGLPICVSVLCVCLPASQASTTTTTKSYKFNDIYGTSHGERMQKNALDLLCIVLNLSAARKAKKKQKKKQNQRQVKRNLEIII